MFEFSGTHMEAYPFNMSIYLYVALNINALLEQVNKYYCQTGAYIVYILDITLYSMCVIPSIKLHTYYITII